MCAIIHFGTDGWRARVDEDFTADNVARIADAVGELWQKTNPGKTVYIGFDTRPLASEFAELAAGVLAAHGLDAVLASRPVPTPALTWAAAYDGEACGALMVTGSHHPQGYLCLKIRMGDGSTANQDVIEELEETMAPEPMGIEGQYRTADIIPDYMQAVASFVDAEAIRAAHLRVVVDPMGGEEAGGIGIAAHMPERDGILACLILCELMAKTDAPLGVLVDQLEDSFGKTSYGRRDLRLEAEDAETLRTLLPGVNPKSICGKVPQNVSHMDGLRLSFKDDTWLLVRPSGTEPVVRVYAEGFSVEERDELLDAGCALARGTYPL